MLIYKVLEEAQERKASDIHLTKGLPPVLRIHGDLFQLHEYGVMDEKILEEQTEALLTEENKKKYERDKFVDFSLEHLSARFRMHIYRQQGCDAYSLRLIPTEIPNIDDLNLPKVIRKFTLVKNGLILVTGTTGSGKSTTLAALINEINETQQKHIITVEDPLEFIHKHKQSIINQKEVGQDICSFTDAVKAAMREDPDILLLGEMRDLDTITNAITMAETGHLVFATLHTKSVAESVDRIIDVFPPNQQQQIRVQLANVLQGIISQQLLRKVGGGRVPACEIMIVTDGLRSMIKEQASPNAINDHIQMKYRELGCQTIYQAVAKLYNDKLISTETAFAAVEDSDLLKQMIMMSC
jgi:twitching motility protein PilT